jgi:hypothetical protein
MRAIKYLLITVVATLLVSIGAFAKDKDKDSGTFDLTQTVKLGSTVLHPGHYKAEWTGPNNALRVSILEHGKTVATVKGTLEELPQAAPYDSVTIRARQDQSKRVKEIRFDNRKDALKLAGA